MTNNSPKNNSYTTKNHRQSIFLRAILFVAERLRKSLERARSEQIIQRIGHVGDNCKFNGRIHVTAPQNFFLGNNVHIGDNAWIRAEGGIRIGSNTHISRNLVIYSINHGYEGRLLPYDDSIENKPVEIGENVWIGMNVCIAPGTVIGEGAIIGMGTTVAGQIPPLSIAVGAKPRIVGYRDNKHYEQLKSSSCFGGVDGDPLS